MEIFFGEDAMKNSSYARVSFDNQMQKIKTMPVVKEYEELAKFFTNQFARKDLGIGEGHEYKINAAHVTIYGTELRLKALHSPVCNLIIRDKM